MGNSLGLTPTPEGDRRVFTWCLMSKGASSWYGAMHSSAVGLLFFWLFVQNYLSRETLLKFCESAQLVDARAKKKVIDLAGETIEVSHVNLWWFNFMILRVFSKLNDSAVLLGAWLSW